MERIAEFPLRRIKSSAEHQRAIQLIVRLTAGPRDRGTSEYLDVLIDLIADYEKKGNYIFDKSKVSAADLVRHSLSERGISVSSFAGMIGIPQSNLSEMLNGKRSWSKAAIRGISSQLHIRAERFLS